jgi:hypothetical protein
VRPFGLLLTLVFLAAACTAGGGDAVDAADGEPSGAPVDPNALYEGFVECETLPDPIEFDAPEEVIIPEGMVVTGYSEVGPLVQLTGFIDATPVDLRDVYAEDAQLVYIEDEGFEAEILIDAGEYRTFLKASIRCRTGSVMAVIGAPNDETDSLPVPGQQPGG